MKKLEEFIKCPHCDKEDIYVFYENAKEIECNNCEKDFDVSLEIKVVVTAILPTRS